MDRSMSIYIAYGLVNPKALLVSVRNVAFQCGST